MTSLIDVILLQNCQWLLTADVPIWHIVEVTLTVDLPIWHIVEVSLFTVDVPIWHMTGKSYTILGSLIKRYDWYTKL